MPPATTLNYTRKRSDVQLGGNPHRSTVMCTHHEDGMMKDKSCHP